MGLLLLTRGGEGQGHIPWSPNKIPYWLRDMTIGECDVVHGVEELIGRSLRFHCRKVSSDAEVATKRERHVIGAAGEFPIRLQIIPENIEDIRFGKFPWITIRCGQQQGNRRAGGDRHAIELDILCCLAHDHQHCGRVAEGFGEGSLDQTAILTHGL